MSDNVKHPSHYCKNGLECIDAIKAAVSTIADPFEAYCTGNIIKYIWRWNDKNGIEDLHKAIQYIDFIEAYRNANKTVSVVTNSNKPTQAEYEEMFTEDKPKGKYEGLTGNELFKTFCDKIACCDENCPLWNDGEGCKFEGWRSKAIAYLDGLEGKA